MTTSSHATHVPVEGPVAWFPLPLAWTCRNCTFAYPPKRLLDGNVPSSSPLIKFRSPWKRLLSNRNGLLLLAMIHLGRRSQALITSGGGKTHTAGQKHAPSSATKSLTRLSRLYDSYACSKTFPGWTSPMLSVPQHYRRRVRVPILYMERST